MGTDKWKETLLRSFSRLVATDLYLALDECYSAGIFTVDEKEKVEECLTFSDRNRHFLMILLHKSEEVYNIFVACLETDSTDHSHIISILSETDVSQPVIHEEYQDAMQLRRKIYLNLKTILEGPELNNLTDDFISQRVFEVDDLEKITNDNLTTKEKNTLFFNILLKKKPYGCHLLISELRKDHINLVEKIMKTVVTEEVDKDIDSHLRIVELQEKAVSLKPEELERIRMGLDPDEISPGKLKAWIEDDKTFYPTRATEYICKEIESKRKVLVSGLPGSGKSANVHHIALQLKKTGYRLYCIQGIKNMIDKIDKFEMEEKQVFVIDDVFGVYGINEETAKDWNERHRDDIDRCLEKRNIFLLCSSRLQVLNDKNLSDILSYFKVINISHGEPELTCEERVEIFRKHASVKKRVDLLKDEVHLRNEIVHKIEQIECPVGCFPLVCRLYVGDKETKQTIEEYFNKPLDELAKHIKSLQNSREEDLKMGYFCLLMCMIYDNNLPLDLLEVGKEREETKDTREELLELCKLPRSTSREEIRDRMDTLVQTFVKLEDETYQFVHDIIHNVVIQHINTQSSSVHKVILRHCSSKFIRNKVHLFGAKCNCFDGSPGHNTEYCINIRHAAFYAWGERVLQLILDGIRESAQLYNDIREDKCSKDRCVDLHSPWWDIFYYNPCVTSTDGDAAISKALASKSPSDVQYLMCTQVYNLPLPGGTKRRTILHLAVYYGLTHTVTLALSVIPPTKLQEVNSVYSLLCLACELRSNIEMVQTLIEGGLNVNIPDTNGRIPLHVSVDLGYHKTVELLIHHGADINKCDEDGESVLYRSLWHGDNKTTEILLNHGADIDKCDTDSESALYQSVVSADNTTTEAVLSNKTDVNKCDKNGRTLLYRSVLRGNYKTTEFLLNHGADINKCDKDDESALYLSQLYGHDTITELLQSRGAVCLYKLKQYNHIIDIPDDELEDGWERVKIQILRRRQVNK